MKGQQGGLEPQTPAERTRTSVHDLLTELLGRPGIIYFCKLCLSVGEKGKESTNDFKRAARLSKLGDRVI